MIEVSESIDCKNGKSMLMIEYRTTSKFERLNIRSGMPPISQGNPLPLSTGNKIEACKDKYVISKIREILIGHNVKKSDETPSHIPRRRRSLF